MTDNKGPIRRMFDAMMERRRQRAERRTKQYLKALGLDEPERD